MGKPSVDQATLTRLLHYDPATGIFTWNRRDDVGKAWNTRYAGKQAGYAWSVPNSPLTYWSIRIFDWPFLAHRLAVLYMTGEWPAADVDHDDRDGLNNRWSNLRPATKSQNSANRSFSKKSSTKLRGAYACKRTGRYRAQICINGKIRWLGYYDTPEEAHAAYCAAHRAEHGEFSRPV